ncbi:HAMP domain-containing histidine kinase [Pedobacter sp. SD-b]|uniref:histidine kinase n=1 Tax=Pedobacter segetis TaxID=2793069 RepID=A0ABS1BLH1_9SPHI|nr:HAMP domain-containing sensor histidine kinase [Pedobacter segetis]MBK0383747.1 HAMP domain-containing histidine kinase [Pedobacter segetis]
MIEKLNWQSIYASLDKISFLRKSFTLKFLFIAFIGIHIPLLGLLFFLKFNSLNSYSPVQIILITLILTLVATMVTLYVLNNLLKPLILSKNALKDFYRYRTLPNLPSIHHDEVGELMRLVNKTLNSLDVLSREKQQLIALVSHNLRTPLTQILSLCELFKAENEGNNFYTDNISKITENQLNDLAELLNQLVQNKNNVVLDDDGFNVYSLVEEDIEKQKFQTNLKSIKVEVENQEELFLPNTIRSNIDLVFHNLLSNAIKFSYPNSIIKVKIFGKADKVYIEVKDQGIGFDDDYKDMIFKNMKNKGRLGTKNEPSIGLGLHLCKKTIQKAGGDLIAKSDGNNKGATFTLIV